jgi:predicted transcriptional regulator
VPGIYYWYERRYESVVHVKTAISLDESLFREAEDWAEKLGVSRSQLFARAVEEYVRRHENEELVRRLDEAHADGPRTSVGPRTLATYC